MFSSCVVRVSSLGNKLGKLGVVKVTKKEFVSRCSDNTTLPIYHISLKFSVVYDVQSTSCNPYKDLTLPLNTTHLTRVKLL